MSRLDKLFPIITNQKSPLENLISSLNSRELCFGIDHHWSMHVISRSTSFKREQEQKQGPKRLIAFVSSCCHPNHKYATSSMSEAEKARISQPRTRLKNISPRREKLARRLKYKNEIPIRDAKKYSRGLHVSGNMRYRSGCQFDKTGCSFNETLNCCL